MKKACKTVPQFNVGDSIRLTCMQGKYCGKGGPHSRKSETRSVRGRVVFTGETFITLQHEPAGWRECFLHEDIRSGRIIMEAVG